MAEPPPTIQGGDKTTGPLCPICKKPYNEHSWMQKQECNRKMKREDRENIWDKEKESWK